MRAAVLPGGEPCGGRAFSLSPANESRAFLRDAAPSPYHSSRRGVIPYLFLIHSTRSGAAGNSDAAERDGTARWFQSNPHGLSAHFIGDAAGGLTPVVPLELAAHHDLARNPGSVGIEMTQPLPTDPFTDGHYAAAAEAFRRVNVWLRSRGHPPIPAVHPETYRDGVRGIVGHEQTNAGKSDPGPMWDWERFVGMLRAGE